MKVTVVSITGKHTEVETEDSVADLHHKLSVQEQLPIDTIQLIYGGKIIAENTLSFYGIKENTSIHMRLNIRGGMFHPTSSRKDYHSLADIKE